MATPTIIVLLAGVIGTVLLVGLTGVVLLGRGRGAVQRATQAVARAQQANEELQTQLAVLDRERARLGASLDELQRLRDEQRRRRSPGVDW